MKTITIPPEVVDLEREILHEFFTHFGKTEIVHSHEEFMHYRCGDFSVHTDRTPLGVMFHIDLKHLYDKTSKCPIHFVAEVADPLSRRRKRRIEAGLSFLLANKKEAGGYFGSMPGFDDLDMEPCHEFYRRSHGT